MNNRRTLSSIVATAAAGAAGAAALTFYAGGVCAQTFPSRNITIYSAGAASANYVLILRSMADIIQQKTGKSIVIEPAVGAGGAITPQRVARADPDGHTIGLVFTSSLTLSPHIMKEVSYDPVRDLAPISLLVRQFTVFSASPKLAANNLQELIVLARAKPGGVKVGFSGIGSRIGFIQVAEAGGVKFLEVPYKSGDAAFSALLSGDVDVIAQNSGQGVSSLQAGTVKVLFSGSKTRLRVLPNVQPIAELYPNIEVSAAFALIAPAKTPADRIAWHNQEWNATLKDPKVAERFIAQGFEIVGSTPQELASHIKADLSVYGRIVKEHAISE